MTNAAVASATMMMADVLAPLWMEMCMFGLAMACYAAFTGLPVKGQLPKGKMLSPRTAKQLYGPPSPGATGGRVAAAVNEELQVPSPAETKQQKKESKPSGASVGSPGNRSRGANTDSFMQAKAISNFGKEGRLDKAVALFDELKQSAIGPNALVFNCLLDACVQCGDMTRALSYFEEMKASRLVDVVSCNTLMKGHLAQGAVDAAQVVLDGMAALNVVPSRVTYHGLLHALAQRGERRKMWAVVEKMRGAEITPNEVTCSILLKSVLSPAHAGDLKRVCELADKCEKPGDEVLLAVFVEACIRSRSLDVLADRTRGLAARGVLATFSSPTYGSMIKAYGQDGNLGRVWELWTQMTSQQITPTAITLGCMIEALVVNGSTRDAWELVNKIWEDESQRSLVNTVIYSTILKGFAMAKQHDKVTELYEEMKARNVPRNTITYNTILNSIARCGLMDRVPALLEEMQTCEPRADPDLVTYSTIIKGYCQSGDVSKALELLREMQKEARLTPDEVMYNSLLDGCARENRLEEALRLLDEMRAAKVAPSNYTLSIVCKLLGRARRLNQAFSMVESVSKEYGFKPNIHVYTCLITACLHNRQVAKAFALHDQIVRDGIVPDEKAYTAMAKGCLQFAGADKAAAVVRCAYGLPNSGLKVVKAAPGVEAWCLKDVIGQLGRSSPVAAAELKAQVQTTCDASRGGVRPSRGAQRY